MTYNGEEWRHGNQATGNVLSFEYGVGNAGLNSGSFIPVSGLNFTAPVVGASPSPVDLALDGNTAPNRTVGV